MKAADMLRKVLDNYRIQDGPLRYPDLVPVLVELERIEAGQRTTYQRVRALALDYGIESLRVGSYEARMNSPMPPSPFQLDMIRRQRERALDRLLEEIWNLAASDGKHIAEADEAVGLPTIETGESND